MTPFREPAASPSEAALARLRALPVHPLRRLGAALAAYREIPSAPANVRLVAAAQRLGFVSLGAAAEGTIPQRFTKQIFVDGTRTTQAHLSTRGYFFVTYFESGKCILTWDHQPRTPTTDLLVQSRATAGGFEADYRAHVAAVKAFADAPIVVADLRAAVALGRHYYRQVSPLGFAALMLVWPAFVLFVAAMLVSQLLRWIR